MIDKNRDVESPIEENKINVNVRKEHEALKNYNYGN